MKHNIKLVSYNFQDHYSSTLFVDNEPLFSDAEYTYNIIGDLLDKLGIDYELEFEEIAQVCKIEKHKMKLVPEK